MDFKERISQRITQEAEKRKETAQNISDAREAVSQLTAEILKPEKTRIANLYAQKIKPIHSLVEATGCIKLLEQLADELQFKKTTSNTGEIARPIFRSILEIPDLSQGFNDIDGTLSYIQDSITKQFLTYITGNRAVDQELLRYLETVSTAGNSGDIDTRASLITDNEHPSLNSINDTLKYIRGIHERDIRFYVDVSLEWDFDIYTYHGERNIYSSEYSSKIIKIVFNYETKDITAIYYGSVSTFNPGYVGIRSLLNIEDRAYTNAQSLFRPKHLIDNASLNADTLVNLILEGYFDEFGNGKP